MKNKYQRMSKEEKKQCENLYYQSEKGKGMKIVFLRLKIIGTIGILFSLFLIISGYMSNKIDWATWVLASILVIFSIIYIVGSIVLKGKTLNNYAIKYMK